MSGDSSGLADSQIPTSASPRKVTSTHVQGVAIEGGDPWPVGLSGLPPTEASALESVSNSVEPNVTSSGLKLRAVADQVAATSSSFSTFHRERQSLHESIVDERAKFSARLAAAENSAAGEAARVEELARSLVRRLDSRIDEAREETMAAVVLLEEKLDQSVEQINKRCSDIQQSLLLKIEQQQEKLPHQLDSITQVPCRYT
eukprot:GHVT01029069.1.p2 GENE.GHVT01029069.1~~GHVT01029069.1.p2  ORF type:complete len:202 (+),score=36.41 GHVT01029069.1:808-1413(+)